ncbi:MAG: hypothetical protein IKI84_08475 [Clostridia bacterium]|nr:hypothetical protein [Clostridia bacterium]
MTYRKRQNPVSRGETDVRALQASPEVIWFPGYYSRGSDEEREEVFRRWNPDRSVFPPCAATEWKDSQGHEAQPRAGQAFTITVQYPFNCQTGGTFRIVYSPRGRFSDGCIQPDGVAGYADVIQLVRCRLLKILPDEGDQAAVRNCVLRVSSLWDFIGKPAIQTSCVDEYLEWRLRCYEDGTDIPPEGFYLPAVRKMLRQIKRSKIHFLNVDLSDARDTFFIGDYPDNYWGDFDEHGWEKKQETTQGEYGTDVLIYTDLQGLDHMIVRSEWSFFDGPRIYIGNTVLGGHRLRLEALHTLRMIWAKNKGKFSYETPWYGCHEFTPPTMYLVKYRPDGAFQDIDAEISEAFGSVRCALIGYFAVQSNALRALVLPRTLERIYDFAFAGCPVLQRIIIPDGCNFRFERRAFEGCADHLVFSAVSGSPVIPVLKRFGYSVEERAAGTMDNAALRAHAAKCLEMKEQPGQTSAPRRKDPDLTVLYNNLLPGRQKGDEP